MCTKKEKTMRQLSEKELGQVAGGKITPVKVNGGGNTPKGEANGVPTENQNPSGFPPPGQN
jgi:hypothetical protein